MFRYFLIFLFLVTNSIFSQGDYKINIENKDKFVSFINSLTPKDLEDLKIQLITVDTSPTVTTAFGHSALRVFLGKQFEDKDFYLDFGEYDESAGFIWRFLKGEAKFYITVKTMGLAYMQWDTTGRGMYASEFKLDANQKKLFLKNILSFIEKYKDGYEYNNFTGNCVTYIRDLIGETYGTPLKLETESNKRTWRNRVIPYSNKIFWLRMEEKLLLDHDTDKERNPTELIYLPYDLLFAVEDAKLVKDKELLHRNFWQMPPDSFDFLGNLMFIILVFIIVGQIPVYFKSMIDRKGEILFGIISGFGGLFALVVRLFTSFPFMDETIMIFVFSPIDFFLLAKKKPSFKIHMGIILLRLSMILLAIVFRFTIYKQTIDTALFFTVIFYVLYAINTYRARAIAQ